MKASAVLFDVDGVLLDSAAAHRRVWDAWSLLRGLDPDTVWALTFGRRPEDTVLDAAPHLDPTTERQVLDRLLAEETDAVLPVDGAPELLRKLPVDAWAIVTSGDRSSVHRRFQRADLPLPRVQVYGADVHQAKPAPDCFALAASRLGVPPSGCVVVEDSRRRRPRRQGRRLHRDRPDNHPPRHIPPRRGHVRIHACRGWGPPHRGSFLARKAWHLEG